MDQINKNRLCALKNTDFCTILTTACNDAYLRSSVLLVQTRPTMVKQLQCSLAAAPAVRYCSLTMHCPQLVGWCYVGYLHSDYTPIGMCGDSALHLPVWRRAPKEVIIHPYPPCLHNIISFTSSLTTPSTFYIAIYIFLARYYVVAM